MKFVWIIGLFFLSSGLYGQPRIDSLKALLNKAESDTSRINTLTTLSQSFFDNRDTTNARLYADSAFSISKIVDYELGVIRSCIIKSRLSYVHNNYNQALEQAQKAINLASQIEKQELLCQAYLAASISYANLGEFDDAISNTLSAIQIAKEGDDKSVLSGAYNNIATFYARMEQWGRTTEYMQKAIAFTDKGDSSKLAIRYLNLGNTYFELESLDEAIVAYKESLIFNKQAKNDYVLSNVLSQLGQIMQKKAKYDSALYYHTEAYEIRKKLKNEFRLMQSLNHLGDFYDEVNDYSKASQFWHEALSIAQKLGTKDFVRDIHKNLSHVYEQTVDYKQALYHRKQYEVWKDSTTGIAHLNKISELELKYETQKKENEILALSKENLEKEAGIEKQSLLIRRLLIGTGVLLIVGILLFIIYKQRSSNQKQNELLQAVTETQEKERIRVARDLHDSVGIMLTAVKHRLEQDTEDGQVNKLIDEAASEVRRISHNMMPGALLKYGLPSAIEQLLSDSELSANLKTQLYMYGMDDRLEMNLEIAIYRILQELIQNILKHAEANNITLQINRHDKNLNIIMEDDGIGIKEKLKALNSGIGLKNIRSRIETWKGKFSIESAGVKGTTVLIDIPVGV
ncbi:MAG: sensor histidine kinase [Bacteroidota bacterium]